MGDTGLETHPLTGSETPISEGAAVKSAVSYARKTPSDPDLARLIDAWPTLPEETKQRIVRLLESPA